MLTFFIITTIVMTIALCISEFALQAEEKKHRLTEDARKEAQRNYFNADLQRKSLVQNLEAQVAITKLHKGYATEFATELLKKKKDPEALKTAAYYLTKP